MNISIRLKWDVSMKYEVHLGLPGTSESGRGAVLRLEGEELERAWDGGQRVGAVDFVLREERRGGECYHNGDLSQENIHFDQIILMMSEYYNSVSPSHLTCQQAALAAPAIFVRPCWDWLKEL